MNATPVVSVVMGVRNAAVTIRETIESVLGQEGVSLELIVVDDASTDGTPAILGELSRSDERLRIIGLEEHGGLTKALVAGCNAARGAYVARQDAGDLSLPSRLVKLAGVLDHNPGVSFVSSWTRFRGPDHEILDLNRGNGRAIGPTWLIDDTHPKGVIDGPSHHGAVMFRRSAYIEAGGYRPEFYFSQDWDLWLRLAALGMFELIPEELYVARIFPRSLSGSNRVQQFALADVSRELLSVRLRGEPEGELLAKAASIHPRVNGQTKRRDADGYYFLGEMLRRHGHASAMRYLREAIRLDPFHVKAWVRLMQATLAVR